MTDLEKLEDAEWTVYHKDEAGDPSLHEGGPWFYQPNDYDDFEVYSSGFLTKKEAIEAAMAAAFIPF